MLVSGLGERDEERVHVDAMIEQGGAARATLGGEVRRCFSGGGFVGAGMVGEGEGDPAV